MINDNLNTKSYDSINTDDHYHFNQIITDNDVVIPTTYRKKLIVASLQDYWNLKGLLLKIKKNPSLKEDVNSQQIIVDYLEKHTSITNYVFWNNLKIKNKLNVVKYFTLVEGHANKQLLSCTSTTPELYVLLSGKVEASNNQNKGGAVYGHGDLFGIIDCFNDFHIAKKQNTKDHKSIEDMYTFNSPKLLTASIERCTLLRLTYKNYLLGVLPPKSKYEGLDEDELLIATSTDLTSEDILCIRFKKQSKKTLSLTLYQFLIDHDILPKNSKSPSYQYMRIGNIGREIVLDKNGPKLVYVIVNGLMRLEVIKPKNNIKNKKSSIICKRLGQRTLHIENSRMPVALLDVGSVFIINEECFNINEQNNTRNLSTSHSSDLSISTPSTNNQDIKIKPNKLINLLPYQYIDIPISSHSKKKVKEEIVYQLQIVFDKPTNYLAFPLELFRNSMKDTSIVVNKEISMQLNQVSSSLVSRILSLLPWINGSMEWNIKKNHNNISYDSDIHMNEDNTKPLYPPLSSAFKKTLGSFDSSLNQQNSIKEEVDSMQDEDYSIDPNAFPNLY